jgi:hypothetical protein
MIQEQYSRISHHTSSITGTTGIPFTVPATEDFTNGSWTPFDLALSEIGVDEFQEKVFIRVGNNIKEFNLGSGSTSGSTLWEIGSSGTDSIKAINSTGLDATGDYALAIGSATTASGDFSFASGMDTTSSAIASHAEGRLTLASGDYSHAGGKQSNSLRNGEWSRSSSVLGQYGIISLSTFTTNATPLEMFIDIGPTTGRFTLEVNTAYKVIVNLVCVDSTTIDTKEFGGTFLIKNVGGTTTFVGAPVLTSTFGDVSLATATASCTADNTNDAIIITVTGIAATSINWFAKMEYTQVNG